MARHTADGLMFCRQQPWLVARRYRRMLRPASLLVLDGHRKLLIGRRLVYVASVGILLPCIRTNNPPSAVRTDYRSLFGIRYLQQQPATRISKIPHMINDDRNAARALHEQAAYMVFIVVLGKKVVTARDRAPQRTR